MADPAVTHTLTTPGGTIVFNDGSDDQFYITDIPDLDDPPIRNPKDAVPFGDGGLIYQSFTGPWEVPVEGHFLILSTQNQQAIQSIRNDMEADLRAALRSIRAPTSGTWAWTPLGEAARSLDVYYDVKLRCPHDQNFLLRAFQFGIVTGDSDYS